MDMRELVIESIKRRIDWRNESNSWKEDFIPEKYPDFEKENDESIFELYENIPKGPCG